MNPIPHFIQQLNDQHLWDTELSLKRNEYLKVKDTTDTNLYFVVSGALRIYIVEESDEHSIRFGYKNNFIASLDSFISEKPSDLYIQALKKTELKVITKSNFMSFVESSAENIKIWLLMLGDLIFQQMERERDILTSSPLERYKRVLTRSPQLFQEVPHKYIASYLRMTPETLSRVKKS
ncbi:Crp/Fnr family transcriptional regulator [Flavobacterium antarcticum]|uniref:Crp/Fnr family transcriptional regulator n=1 Tax=Flavobacterium antarcticum TaxID=271155 RepID=UPI0003B4A82E|nr:Crp/Fnr family transcriptional regulator [Flavobacterium antarcticum]